MKMKIFFKKAVVVFLALLMALGGFASAVSTRAAGSVNVESYAYGELYARLALRYPNVFTWGVVRDLAGNELGFTDDVRYIYDGYWPLESNIDGSPTNESKGTQGWHSFQGNGERFFVGGDIAYCFDHKTAAGNNPNVFSVSGSLAEAGINVFSESVTMDVAKAAKALTENNFALITQNANQIATAFTSTETGGRSYSKSDLVAVLQATDADATAFKRMLVQSMVWYKMNQIKFVDSYPSYQPVYGYTDKEGNYHAPEDVVQPPTVGITALYDLDKMLTLGVDTYNASSQNVGDQYKRQYELSVGEPFTVPAADVGIVRTVINANGGKIEPSGTVTVSDNGTTITLTATQPIASWTNWLNATVPNDAIYSSKPYVMGSTSGGQFIVNPSGMDTYLVRVKADKVQVSYDPIGILLSKKDAQSQDEVRPVAH